MYWHLQWKSGFQEVVNHEIDDDAMDRFFEKTPECLSMCSKSRVIGPNSADTLEDWTLDDLAPLDGGGVPVSGDYHIEPNLLNGEPIITDCVVWHCTSGETEPLDGESE